MRRSRIIVSLVLVGLLGTAAFVGVGWRQYAWHQYEQRNSDMDDLNMLGFVYLWFNQEHRRGPSDLAELEAELKGDKRTSHALTGLKEGRYVITWGVAINDYVGKPDFAEHVLGYRSDVPQSGGPVLMADAVILSMTPEEFKASKHAVPVAKGS